MRLLQLALAAVAIVGVALLLDSIPWFRRRPLAARLAPYGPYTCDSAASTTAHRRSGHGGSSPAAVLLPLVDQAIGRITAALGVRDELATRLERADVAMTTVEFRARQSLHAVSGLAAAAIIAVLTSPGAAMSVLLCLGCPVLWVLLDEQALTRAITTRASVLQLELPVVAEQLGVLIDAGTSLPGALARIAHRGRGAAASDLRRVSLRIRQGSSEIDALTEWVERTDVVAVRRLVAVLALHRDATNLGRLISAEARAIRAETHRDLVERIERRGQLVWIPVTVATLVPGLIFLAVPFVSALSQVTGA